MKKKEAENKNMYLAGAAVALGLFSCFEANNAKNKANSNSDMLSKFGPRGANAGPDSSGNAVTGTSGNATSGANVHVRFNEPGLSNATDNNAAYSTLMGYKTGGQTMSGVKNTFVGALCAASTTKAEKSSGFGYKTMLNTTTGKDNAAFGYETLQNNITGSGNVAIGKEALEGQTGNSYVTAVGYKAAIDTGSDISYSIALGANSAVTASNTMVIGGADSGEEVTSILPGATEKTRLGSQTKEFISISLKAYPDNAAAKAAGAEVGDIAVVGGAIALIT
tara:strand:- start:449 stop:1285 length:837 start_codon:yes stop_codon:yes gene_type:complete